MTDLKDLKKIIPFKWRIQSFSKNYPSATCVAYIDARDVMDLLDEIVGPENWQSDYKEIKGNLYSGIAIKMTDEWVWKWDCGTEPFTEKAKGEASDAFKRAAVKWGIGRFLYDLPIQYVKTSDIKRENNYPFPVHENGQKINDLTLYLNESSKVSFIVNHLFDNPTTTKNTKKVNKAIEEVEKCNNLDELRKVREENQEFEFRNSKYKKSLSKKYENLSVKLTDENIEVG